jgi:hypothetical protein
MNRVLSRVERTGGWRKVHNDGLHNLYSSPSIFTIIRSKKIKWAKGKHTTRKTDGWIILR